MFCVLVLGFFFFFSSRRRHTIYWRDWSSDVCSSDLATGAGIDRLLTAIDAALPVAGVVTLSIPHADGPALALCYERGRVLARADGPDAVRLEVQLPRALRARLAPYLIGPPAASIEMLD